MEMKPPADLPYPLLPHERTLAGACGMVVTRAEDGLVAGRLPLEDRVRQAYGALHGAAVAILAESLSSIGTCMGIDMQKDIAFGQEINYSLLRTVWDGHVDAVARAIHRGRTAWVWDVQITDAKGKLIAVSRCTIAVRPRRE